MLDEALELRDRIAETFDRGDLLRKVVESRIEGATYEQIAEQFGISPLEAVSYVREYIGALPQEDDETQRELLFARLERLFAIAYAEAMDGRLNALAQALNILKQIIALRERGKGPQVDEEEDKPTLTIIEEGVSGDIRGTFSD